MRLLGFYISREFIFYFLACTISLVSIAVTFVALSELDILEESGVEAFFRTILSGVPLLIEIIAPIAVLLSTVLTYTSLSKSSEVIAMKAAGLSLFQLILPLFVCGIFISGFIYFNQSYLAPWWGGDKIKGVMSTSPSDSIWRFYKGKLFYFEGLSKADKSVSAGIVYKFNRNNELKEISELKGIKERGKQWKIRLKKDLTFKNNSVQKLAELPSQVVKKKFFPVVFKKEIANPKYIGFSDLVAEIKIKKNSGISYQADIFAFYQKISALLSIFVMMLLALPFSLFSGRQANVRGGIVISVILGFVFWLADQIFIKLNGANVLSAEVAAFGANMIFIALAMLIVRLKKS